MTAVVMQGGTNGIGKGIAAACLRRGDRALVVGRSERNGEEFLDATRALGASHRAPSALFYLSRLLSTQRRPGASTVTPISCAHLHKSVNDAPAALIDSAGPRKRDA